MQLVQLHETFAGYPHLRRVCRAFDDDPAAQRITPLCRELATRPSLVFQPPDRNPILTFRVVPRKRRTPVSQA